LLDWLSRSLSRESMLNKKHINKKHRPLDGLCFFVIGGHYNKK